MLTIYTPSASPRLEYTLKVVFKEVLGVEYKCIHDRDAFAARQGVKINYSPEPTDHAMHIYPSGLLHQKEIAGQEFSTGRWDDLPVIFACRKGTLPFDLFAAVFYLVSRYEEYLPSIRDRYGRFQAEESVAYYNDFLHRPIVDLWCAKLADMLGIRMECKNIAPFNYRFHLTVDVDQPWLYRNKGALYSTGALLRDLVTFRFADLKGRIKTLLHRMPDPADTFGYLERITGGFKTKVNYFILCQKRGKYDKNRSLNRPEFNELVRKLDKVGKVGIHPSFASFEDHDKLDQELAWLKNILGREMVKSRQHYLLFTFPETCRILIERGIREDYSLGYSSQTGFRTGLARPNYFYDLEKEEETGLRLHPLIVMDRTLKDYRKADPERALREYHAYRDRIRAVGGTFICLWHNDAVSDRGEWKGWRMVFEELINWHAEK